jgi:hypothetical protein
VKRKRKKNWDSVKLNNLPVCSSTCYSTESNPDPSDSKMFSAPQEWHNKGLNYGGISESGKSKR